MAKAALFVIAGFEELEAVTIVDVLRRGSVALDVVSLGPALEVKSKHDVILTADLLFKNFHPEQYDLLIIPGGTISYLDHKEFMDLVAASARAGQKIAAICAAPVVLGRLGLLKGRQAVCFPGLENELTGAIVPDGRPPVVTDGPFTTSRGPATAMPFALELLAILSGKDASTKIAKDMLVA
ncbi:MAG: DJ-1/PfpI family protein [Deltaproteobacteria bacterium]|jgi:4-methyl-5(b-hydroxyethyl)-thiazole monophosphate biosynthesis|nr:DJ-1/PfpI family protein [Deltaproteobacteria bacterium]